MSTPPTTNDPWSADSSTQLPKPTTGGRRWALLGIAIFLDLVAFGVLGLAYYKIFVQSPNVSSDSAASTQPSNIGIGGGAIVAISMREPDLFISKGKQGDLPADAKVYSSINDALANCGAGATVRIADQEVYEEQILHGRRSGSNSSVNIKIVAEPGPDGKTATLRLPKDAAPGSPLVHLESAEGFTIIGMTLDGQDRADDLVLMSGNCPGATFDNCHMLGYKHAAIRLVKCEGKNDELGVPAPIHLRGLRFDSPANGKHEDVTPILLQGDNQDVIVQRCRFNGPWTAPLLVEGSLRNGQFDHNLFHGDQKAALLFGKEPGASPALDIRLLNNTFCGCQNAVMFQQVPEAGSALTFHNNVFYQVAHGIGVAEGRVTIEQIADTLQGANNVRDPKTRPEPWQKLAKVQCEELKFELPTKPEKDARLLRYPVNSPLTKSGQKGTYVGALPPVLE